MIVLRVLYLALCVAITLRPRENALAVWSKRTDPGPFRGSDHQTASWWSDEPSRMGTIRLGRTTRRSGRLALDHVDGGVHPRGHRLGEALHGTDHHVVHLGALRDQRVERHLGEASLLLDELRHGLR